MQKASFLKKKEKKEKKYPFVGAGRNLKLGCKTIKEKKISVTSNPMNKISNLRLDRMIHLSRSISWLDKGKKRSIWRRTIDVQYHIHLHFPSSASQFRSYTGKQVSSFQLSTGYPSNSNLNQILPEGILFHSINKKALVCIE